MRCLLLVAVLFTGALARAETVRVKVESNTDVDDVVKNLRKQFNEQGGYTLEVVFDGTHEFRIVGVSESSMSGAQGTLVVLSNQCEVITAVTRSGRMTTGGAFNAASKEVVKQLEAMGVIGR